MSPRITPLTDAPSDPSTARRLAWLADDEDGNPVGSAFVRLSGAEGRSHLADLDLHVHPAERRRGVGTRLLAAALRAARDEGRRALAAEVRAGSAGEAFLAARGFRTALTLLHVRLAPTCGQGRHVMVWPTAAFAPDSCHASQSLRLPGRGRPITTTSLVSASMTTWWLVE